MCAMFSECGSRIESFIGICKEEEEKVGKKGNRNRFTEKVNPQSVCGTHGAGSGS
jgi:hypothetical protein